MRIAEKVRIIEQKARDPSLTEEQRDAAIRTLGQLDELFRANPLQRFEPHEPLADEQVSPQEAFFQARTPIVAAFAGNRFGKTTALVVRALIECTDEALLPEHLRSFKRWTSKTAPRGTFGRIVCPDFTATAEGVILPAFRQWGAKQAFAGGGFDKAWDKTLRRLNFANGSWIQVMTYEQDVDKFGGAALHFVGYDEPPPLSIREECWARLVDFGGYEMFAMTPLKANTGWIRRDVWKKRESPDVTVIKGSIHHNNTLDEETKNRFLSGLSNDLWRQAREFGDFVDIGGLIYADFERIVIDRPSGNTVRSLDVACSIDPGVRNAAFIFGGFNSENSLTVFDEVLIQDGTVEDYARGIDGVFARWGINRDQVDFIIDPAGASKTPVNGENVDGALARLGIFCAHGNNRVEAGIQQVRSRIQHSRLKVSRECVGLRDEADEYAAEDRDDGEFKPIKQNDHRLDALRYLCMHRPFDAVVEAEAVKPKLGWQPDVAPDFRELQLAQQVGPMGSMS